MLVGTPGWMAPEQFRNGSVGPAADVFSWGSLVAYAATGHNPWSHAQSGPSLSPAEQAHRILHGVPDLGGLAGPLRRLVESALAKDPTRRPTARQLVDALLGGPTGPGGPGRADPTRAAATALQQTWAPPARPAAVGRPSSAGPISGRPVGAGSAPARPGTTSGRPGAGAPGSGPPAGVTRAGAPGSGSPPGVTGAGVPGSGPPAGVTRALPAQRAPATRVMPPAAPPTPPPTSPPTPPPVAKPAAKPVEERPRKRRRRWWTRKRMLIPLGLLAVVVLLANRGDSTAPPVSGSQLGAPVRDGNLEFVVSGVRCGVPQVGSGLVKRTAGGQYCLADVRATNVKDDARTLYEPFQKLVDSAGHKHSADLTMRVVFRDQTIWDKIQPGQQVRGTMVFDIPRNVSATALELHDGIASGGVTVRIR
jgi:hypothetical protein